jgi:hypothetical protein
MNGIQVITLSRQELYEQVWTTPTTKVAKSYGFSDVMLTKICKKYHIPKPPLGYWAKIRHGYNIPRTPLPEIVDPDLQTIRLHQKPQSQAAAMQNVDSKKITDEAVIVVPDRLLAPHHLVKKTAEALKSVTRDNDGILLLPRNEECLDIAVGKESSRRALLLMDTLIKSLESRGCSVVISLENDKRVTSAQIAGEKVQFRLRELLERREMTPTEKKQHEHRPWLHRFAPYVYFPSGRFVLSIEEYLDGLRHQWSDGKKQKLENCLNAFIGGMFKAAEVLKARHLEWERQKREREEQERRRHEQEQRQIEEQNKIKHLDALLANWTKSRKVREFVHVLEEVLKERNIEPDSNLSAWLRWARRYADSIDPILLTFPANEADVAGDRDNAEGEAEKEG